MPAFRRVAGPHTVVAPDAVAVTADPGVAPHLIREAGDAMARVATLAGMAPPAVHIHDAPDMINAVASEGRTVRHPFRSHNAVHVSSGLLRNLGGQERDSVFAHELAHLRARHSLMRMVHAAGTVAVAIATDLLVLSRTGFTLFSPLEAVAAGSVILAAGFGPVRSAFMRRQEIACDRRGARTIGDPAALQRGLALVDGLNSPPVAGWQAAAYTTARYVAGQSTHPSHAGRSRALARQARRMPPGAGARGL